MKVFHNKLNICIRLRPCAFYINFRCCWKISFVDNCVKRLGAPVYHQEPKIPKTVSPGLESSSQGDPDYYFTLKKFKFNTAFSAYCDFFFAECLISLFVSTFVHVYLNDFLLYINTIHRLTAQKELLILKWSPTMFKQILLAAFPFSSNLVYH